MYSASESDRRLGRFEQTRLPDVGLRQEYHVNSKRFQEAVMGSAKEEVRRMLEQIPDSASFEDIQYHIYVREKIDRGLEDVKQGRVIEQAEVERGMRKLTGE